MNIIKIGRLSDCGHKLTLKFFEATRGHIGPKISRIVLGFWFRVPSMVENFRRLRYHT